MSGGASVLVVDDEVPVQLAVARGLERAGHAVATAATGTEALYRIAEATPDLVVLDLRLPDRSGIDVIRAVRTWSAVPVVFLSGSGAASDRVAALDAGADDYVVKPFSLDELRARVEAVLRRARGAAPPLPSCASFDGLELDVEQRQVSVDGVPVRLTPKQFGLLVALARRPGAVHTHESLLHEVWGEGYGVESRQTLRAHIRQLRARLGDDVDAPRFVATEPGVGYRFVAEAT